MPDLSTRKPTPPDWSARRHLGHAAFGQVVIQLGEPVVAIDMLADPEQLSRLDLTIL